MSRVEPYEARLDAFELYHKYQEEYPNYLNQRTPQHDNGWKNGAILRGPALPALGQAIAGATGAAISNFATYPLSLIVARLQIQRGLRARKGKAIQEEDGYKGLVDAGCKIYKEEGGLRGMYTGILQDTGKTVADSFLFFLGYTFLRQQRQRQLQLSSASKGKRGTQHVLPVLDELTIGFLAGSVTKLFTTPIANIVTRKQTGSLLSEDGKGKKDLSSREIAGQIRAEKGIKGFWAGYPASLILTLNPSITFFLYELFKNTLLPRSKREKPPPGATFILAALSKVIASSITYPFSLAKTQAQAQAGSKGKGKESEKGGEERGSGGQSIFASLLEIVRTEGAGGLYAGLPADMLKGFFSHGITILMKDLVYRFIVQGYYLFLFALRRYPTPEELVERAREQVDEFAHVARENATDAAEKVKEKGGDVVSGAVEGGKKAARSLENTTNETAELVRDYVEEEAQEWRSLYRWFREKVNSPVDGEGE